MTENNNVPKKQVADFIQYFQSLLPQLTGQINKTQGNIEQENLPPKELTEELTEYQENRQEKVKNAGELKVLERIDSWVNGYHTKGCVIKFSGCKILVTVEHKKGLPKDQDNNLNMCIQIAIPKSELSNVKWGRDIYSMFPKTNKLELQMFDDNGEDYGITTTDLSFLFNEDDKFDFLIESLGIEIHSEQLKSIIDW